MELKEECALNSLELPRNTHSLILWACLVLVFSRLKSNKGPNYAVTVISNIQK